MNPFSYGTAVKNNYFYDRKDDCKRIVDTLTGGNNIVLYAPRRYGKTSLVFKAIEKLEKAGFICVYFDFMTVFSPESFVRLYTRALMEKQSNINKFFTAFTSIIKSIKPVMSIGQDGQPEFSLDFANTSVDETVISQLLDMPEQLSNKGKKIIVFFDEFQEVEKLKNINFEALLRSKIQRQQETTYLFLGSKTHILKEMFNSKKRPFYNSAFQMSIDKIPEKYTIDFLQDRFSKSNITISQETSKYLIDTASNIPYYIQLLASEIWQKSVNEKKIITHKIIDESAKNVIMLNKDYYMELFDRQPIASKQLLIALWVILNDISYLQSVLLNVQQTT